MSKYTMCHNICVIALTIEHKRERRLSSLASEGTSEKENRESSWDTSNGSLWGCHYLWECMGVYDSFQSLVTIILRRLPYLNSPTRIVCFS